MRIFWLFFVRVSLAFSSNETQIISALFDYFKADYLDLLDENFYSQLSYHSSEPFHSEKLVLTAVLTTPEKIISQLTGRRFSGMTVVAARADDNAWQSFVKLTGESTLRAAKWILFSSKMDDVNSIYIPFDCQFIVVNMKGSLPIIKEVYHTGKNEPLQSIHFGYWDPKNGLSAPANYFYTRRPDFKGHTFKVAVENFPPYTYVEKLENGTLKLSGFFYEVWKELERRLKFNTEFHHIRDSALKAITQNGLGFSVMPEVQRPSLARVVSLNEPIYEIKAYLFGNRPGSELEWDSYLKPFSVYTWYATLGWMLISSAAMSILYYLSWVQNTSETEAGRYVYTVPVCFETVLRAICAQGSDVTPRSVSCRLSFVSIYMAALIVTSAFSAALFSLLTIPVSRAPFNTFREVISKNVHKIGIVYDSHIYYSIMALAERFPDSDQSKLLKMMEPRDQLPTTIIEALERVCNRKDYLFLGDLPLVIKTMQGMNQTCQEKIMPGGPMVFKEKLSYIGEMDNPYKELIDLQLLRLKNEGVLHRLILHNLPTYIPHIQTSWVRVTLADISPILYMFAAGAVMAIVILTVENLHWRFYRKNRKVADRVESSAWEHSSKLNAANTPDTLYTPEYTDWGTTNGSLHRRQKQHHQ